MAWEEKDGRLVYTADHEEPTEDLNTLEEEFNNACSRFRAICMAIRTLINNPDFKGGLDEMDEFEASEEANTPAGMALAMRWMAADKLCTYKASKIGLGQPQWWHKCWETNS